MKPLWPLLLATFLLASCSKYSGDFQTAAKNFKPEAVPLTPAGPWKGTWKSEVNGHTGPLWCLVSQDKKDLTIWNFRYRAGWGILKFGDYNHPVKTKLTGNRKLPLQGEMTLPNNFGTYKVIGTLTPENFKVRYNGNGDKGTMTLTRPKARKQAEN
ncbi:MAG: hypothetical protein ACJAQT_001843 [Akkermansiaceae bacterium]|jgi:hypothetical protein